MPEKKIIQCIAGMKRTLKELKKDPIACEKFLHAVYKNSSIKVNKNGPIV